MVGPGKLSERQFHDAVLKKGPMPIELLRAALRDIPLPKDAQPSWCFRGIKKRTTKDTNYTKRRALTEKLGTES